MKPFFEQRRPVWVNRQQNLDFPPHHHDAVEIVYVLEGTSTALCDSRKLSLCPGDLFVAFPGQVHGYENTRDFEGYVLIITSSSLAGYGSVLEQKQPAQSVLHPEGAMAESFVTMLQQMYLDRKQSPPPMLQGYGLVLFGKLLPMLELIPRPESADALQSALRYIGNHYRESITRGDIAQAVGYSEGYLSHLFTQFLGTSLTGYVTTLRLGEAKKLLRESETPVGQIALSLGFSSIRSFNRFFHKETGISPTQYRKDTK